MPGDSFPRGNWWEVFDDEALNLLEERARRQSPRLQAAAARVEQARAVLGFAEANNLPTLEFVPDAARIGVSENRPDQPDKAANNRAYSTNRFRLPLVASYEFDMWGKLSRQQESAGARLDAHLAAYRSVLLTLQGDLAQVYFQLRATDEDLTLLRHGIELRRSARDLVAARKRGGLASELDLSRVETEVALIESEIWVTERRRRELQHAMAVLVGSTPGAFDVSEPATRPRPPAVPVGLPADILERRPDVAEAERLLVARNAEIGIAKAAFFPSIRLTGSYGFESDELADLVDPGSRIWSLGAALAQPIFDGGRLRANEARARAAYAENLAQYRDRILVAFKEVETALAALRMLDLQYESQARALEAAERTERLASARYRTGLTTLLELIDAQRTRLSAERGRLQVQNQQMQASVALIRALGGGWEKPVAAPVGRSPEPEVKAPPSKG